ncbi:hypothetical protein D1872_298960 [compost metagenome]
MPNRMIREIHSKLGCSGLVRHDRCGHLDPPIHIGPELGVLDIRLRAGFQPNRLPDAANFTVPLLSARLVAMILIFRPHQDRIAPVHLPDPGYLKLKRTIAALMGADMAAVNPDIAYIIHRSKA